MKQTLRLVGLLLTSLAASLAAGAPPTIRTLILSGQNNHAWQQTTPLLKQILLAGRMFSVEVVEHPEQCPTDTFARYNLVLSNWNALGPVKSWPAPTLEALLTFVERGGGLVVVHAGGTMFHDQPRFQQLIGATWGPGTGHGPKHSFEVQIVDAQHPITQGLAAFRTTDELWHRMQTKAEYPRQILATAFSAKEQGGSGQAEPLVFVAQFGKGRCFNLVLGHDVPAMENLHFRTLLLRGAQWAATGQVTIAAADTVLGNPDELVKSLARYRFGDDRADLVALEKLVGAVSSEAVKSQALAAQLAAVLDSSATDDGKLFALRMLARIGTPAEASALGRRLADPKLGLLARFALERIPGPESLDVLREALKSASSQVKVGLIDSLGARRDQQSIPTLAQLLSSSDLLLVNAAIRALGAIGGDRAAQTLLTADAALPAEQRRRLSKALLRCAESLLATGHTAQAAALFERLLAAERPPAIRIAAFLGRVAAVGEKGNALVLAGLGEADPVLQTAAVRAICVQTNESLLSQVNKTLPALPPAVQAQVLAILAERDYKGVLPAAVQAVGSPDPTLKAAAITAVGAVGDASIVALLAQTLENSLPTERPLITESLARLRGPGVDEALVAALAKATPGAARELIPVLVARAAKASVPALLTAAQTGDGGVRSAAMGALGKLADASEGPHLLALLDKGADSDAVGAAVVAIYSRLGDPTPLVAAMEQAQGAKQATLVAMLGALGGGQSLAAIRGVLKSDDAEVRTAAIRALADWPDAATLNDLAAAAATAESLKCKVLALRGIARLAPLAKDRPVPEVAALVAQALASAARPEEIRGLLAALAGVPSPEGLKAAVPYLKDPVLKNEAALTVTKITAGLGGHYPAEVAAAIKEVRAACGETTFFVVSETLPAGENLARGAKAANLDGLHPDGQGGGPEAAIDGDPKTYWDEVDHQKLYWLRVTLKSRATVTALRITGFAHQHYAPRDFEVLCDGKVVQKVVGAQYERNQFGLKLPPTECQNVELKITDYYGPSPAIRELEIIGKYK